MYQPGKSGQELKAWTLRQERKERPWRNAAYWLLPRACSVCFLIATRTASHGMAPRTVSWALPRQSRKCRTGLPTGDVFSVEVTASQMTLIVPSSYDTSQHKHQLHIVLNVGLGIRYSEFPLLVICSNLDNLDKIDWKRMEVWILQSL